MTERPDPTHEQLCMELCDAIEEFTIYILTVPEQLREIPIIGHWSLKDVLAHYTGWNISTIRDAQAALAGDYENIRWIPDEEIDSFNEESVSARRNLDYSIVYNEFLESCTTLINLYTSLDEEGWNTSLLPNDLNTTLIESLKIDIEHYKETHLPEIKEAISKLQGIGNL
jgi:hypothetical protein